MKNIILTITLLLTFLSCDKEVKSESQTGIIEAGDAKSLAVDAFNDAYLANDMTGQEALFTDDAIANVNSQKMTPSEMMDAFMGGREFYNDIKNNDRATSTFTFEGGAVYTSTWFDWEGTSKSTDVVVGNPVHAWFKWDGDKVSEVAYIFDSAEYVANMGQ
jgi:hypothetical protein|tara:strand:+ start:61 stop:543 length:483 start_codon:yes stop_codon:yes gene_type:complete